MSDTNPSVPSDPTVRGSGVLIAVATYNERENLPLLVERIRATVPDADILVVDDNSPDGTGQWVLEQAKKDEHLLPMNRSGKLGLGTAVIAALQFAVEKQYKYVVNMDADFSHPVEVIPDLIRRAEQADHPADVVIGSRYVKGGGVVGWPLVRRFMSRGINLFARVMLRLSTRDNSGSFRCYRVSLLEKFDFNSLRSRGYSFFEEVLYRLKRIGATFAEVPITFTDRTRGVSKINKKEALTAVWLLFRIGLFRNR